MHSLICEVTGMCDVMLLFSVSIAGREIRFGDGKYECRHSNCEELIDPLVDCQLVFVTDHGVSYLVLICLACNSYQYHWYVIFTCHEQMAWGLVFLYLLSGLYIVNLISLCLFPWFTNAHANESHKWHIWRTTEQMWKVPWNSNLP
jgi:hypothetical protein